MSAADGGSDEDIARNPVRLKGSTSSFWPRRLLREDLQNFLKSESSSTFDLDHDHEVTPTSERNPPKQLPSFIRGTIAQLAYPPEEIPQVPNSCELKEYLPVGVEPWHGFDYEPVGQKFYQDFKGKHIADVEASSTQTTPEALEAPHNLYEEELVCECSLQEKNQTSIPSRATLYEREPYEEKQLDQETQGQDSAPFVDSPVFQDDLTDGLQSIPSYPPTERFGIDSRVIAGSNDDSEQREPTQNQEAEDLVIEIEKRIRKRLIQFAAIYWVLTFLLHSLCAESTSKVTDWFSQSSPRNPVCELFFNTLWIFIGIPAVFGTSFVAIALYEACIPTLIIVYQTSEATGQSLLVKLEAIRDAVRMRVQQAAAQIAQEAAESDGTSDALRRIANQAVENFRAGNELPDPMTHASFEAFPAVVAATNADPQATGIASNTLIVAVPGRANSGTLPIQCQMDEATAVATFLPKVEEFIDTPKAVIPVPKIAKSKKLSNKAKELIDEPDLSKSFRNSTNLRTSKKSPTHILPLVFSTNKARLSEKLTKSRSFPGNLQLNGQAKSAAVQLRPLGPIPANVDTFQLTSSPAHGIPIRQANNQHPEDIHHSTSKCDCTEPSRDHIGCKQLQKFLELKAFFNPARRRKRFRSFSPKRWFHRPDSE